MLNRMLSESQNQILRWSKEHQNLNRQPNDAKRAIPVSTDQPAGLAMLGSISSASSSSSLISSERTITDPSSSPTLQSLPESDPPQRIPQKVAATSQLQEEVAKVDAQVKVMMASPAARVPLLPITQGTRSASSSPVSSAEKYKASRTRNGFTPSGAHGLFTPRRELVRSPVSVSKTVWSASKTKSRPANKRTVLGLDPPPFKLASTPQDEAVAWGW